MSREVGMPPSDGGGGGGAMTYSTGTNEWSRLEPCLEMGRPGSVPFVSDRPGAYGRFPSSHQCNDNGFPGILFTDA